MGKPTLKVTSDFTKNFQEVVAQFKNDAVLVGVPATEASRQESGINNAALLAINEFGSPINNIPARPVMAIGINNAQEDIADLYKRAAKDALSKGVQVLGALYERIGIVASTAVKKAINSQEGIEAPSEATLKARKSKGFLGEKALIVTGQLRNSITYIVQRKF